MGGQISQEVRVLKDQDQTRCQILVVQVIPMFLFAHVR